MTAVLAVPIGPDGLGGAFQNDIGTRRATDWFELGRRPGVLKGLSWSAVSGLIALDLAAGADVVPVRDASAVVQDEGYFLRTPPGSATVRVFFNPASASARNDALVAAVSDTSVSAAGTGALAAGGHLVAVPGVSGTSTPRTDAQINAWVGGGGWNRLADVPIASTDTQINAANITDQRAPGIGTKWLFTPKVYATATPTTPVSITVTPGECWYQYLTANIVLAHAYVQITNAVTAPLIDLPVPGAYRQLGIGACGLYGATTPTDQSGQGYMESTATKLVCAVAWNQSFRDAAAANFCRYMVTYEV